jgi:hypothetical protein
MTPSFMCNIRRAWAAMSGSCVTITTVMPPRVQSLEDAHDLLGAFRVQVAGRLIGQDHAGVVHQGAGDGDACC